MNAVMVVAHPDDEIIWAGGVLLRHPDWDWTVLSLCRADDPDRRPKFERVCRRLGVRGLISDLDDGDPLGEIDPERDIAGRVIESLGSAEWDWCLTHGRNGEYGHLRHRQVHQAVAALVGRGDLSCRSLWTFACQANSPAGPCRAAEWADIHVALSPAELAEKKRIVRDEYGYPEDGFEVRACVSPEGFARIKGRAEDGAIL